MRRFTTQYDANQNPKAIVLSESGEQVTLYIYTERAFNYYDPNDYCTNGDVIEITGTVDQIMRLGELITDSAKKIAAKEIVDRYLRYVHGGMNDEDAILASLREVITS